MNTVESHDTKPNILDKLSHFLTRHRLALIIFLVVVAVAVVGLFVALEISTNRTERALVLVEALQTSYGEWLLLDQDLRATEFDTLVSEIEDLVDSYPRTYAAQRAVYLHAGALTELERWNQASEHYVDLADRFPDAYLAPISLTQAAVAAENNDDRELALDILNRLVEQYAAESAEIPRALFSIGRINEGLDNII
ncbi:MAG: hypothetical protein KOO61_05485, partial [Spirochaetales bacterium]|nr:hypothetical protein [Spirochaetales bacterium]